MSYKFQRCNEHKEFASHAYLICWKKTVFSQRERLGVEGTESEDLNTVSYLSIPVSIQSYSEKKLYFKLFLVPDNASDHPKALLFVQNDNKVIFQG